MSLLVGLPYCLALVGFVVFGLHRLLLLWTFFVHRHWAQPGVNSEGARTFPAVCIQCPIFNEPFVVEALLESVTAIEWPRDRLEIQILDDSTDQTSALIRGWIESNPASAACCRHVRRGSRSGYKAGALRHGMSLTRAGFFAILDADFRPARDFLQHLMPRFSSERVGVVQARWDFINRSRNFLTRVQAVFLDAHFLVEQSARFRAGLFLNFNGTAGILRRTAIEDAGGWGMDSITEDLDLCYRMQMRGWRIAYDCAYVVPSELPEGIAAFKTQQRRWARGGVQVFRRHIRSVLSGNFSRRVKLEAVFHLGASFLHVFVMLFALTLVPALLVADLVPGSFTSVMNPLLLLAGTGATVGLYLSSQFFRERRIGHGLLVVIAAPVLMAFGFAMGVSLFFAVVEGMFAEGGEFVRTPKGGSRARVSEALRRSIAGRGMKTVTTIELAIGLMLAAAVVHFLGTGGSSWVIANLALQSLGFVALAVGSVRDFGWRAYLPATRNAGS